VPSMAYLPFSLIVDTLELSLDNGMLPTLNLFIGCELLMVRLLLLGDKCTDGEMVVADMFWLMLLLLLLLLLCWMLDTEESDDVEVKFEWFEFKGVLRALAMCDKGTLVDEDEFFTVFTLLSDKASNFLTASGE